MCPSTIKSGIHLHACYQQTFTESVQLVHGASAALRRALIEKHVHMQGRLQHQPDDLNAALQKTLKGMGRQEVAEGASEQQARQA